MTEEQFSKLSINDNSNNSSSESLFQTLVSLAEKTVPSNQQEFEKELREILKNNPNPIIVDGFEASGRLHIGNCLLKIAHIRKLSSLGAKFILVIGDWHTMMNNKLDKDLKKIKNVGLYMVEVFKALNVINSENTGNIQLFWASEEINKRPADYWPLVLDIARNFSVGAITACTDSMGRSGEQDILSSMVFYPCMQTTDLFFFKADIALMGVDQQTANSLSREFCEKKATAGFTNFKKPVVISHHLLSATNKLSTSDTISKMSSSDQDLCIFMDDSEIEVNGKVKKAFCAPQQVSPNPCLEYVKFIVFPLQNQFTVSRKPEDGGETIYTSYENVEQDFASGKIHPGDLKPSLTKAINQLLQPVRDHFKGGEPAKILKTVRAYKQK